MHPLDELAVLIAKQRLFRDKDGTRTDVQRTD